MALFRSARPTSDDLLQPIAERFSLVESRLGSAEAALDAHLARIDQTDIHAQELANAIEAIRREARELNEELSARLEKMERGMASVTAPVEAGFKRLAAEIARLEALTKSALESESPAEAATHGGNTHPNLTRSHSAPSGEVVAAFEGARILRRLGKGDVTVVAFVAPPVPAPRNLRRISQFVNATQAPALIVQVAAAGGFDDPTINAELEVRLHRNQLGTTGRLVAVGCGAGGRAALAFAAVMEADAAIAFSPSGLPANVDWERAYVVTDPAAAAAYQTNPIFEAMASRIVPAYLLDDSGIDLIAETSSVTALLALAAERASPAALRRLLRGCRAGSASYWRALSTHLRAKAPRWSVARHGALERAYRLQPADLETMIVLADSLLENGRRDQALPLLDNLWERAGEVPAPQLIWRLFMAAGQFARARDVSWQAVHERPLDPMPRLNLARALARMSQIEAAMTQLDLAREYAGNNRQVLTQIRQVQERLGKAGAAVPAGSAAGRHE